MKQKSSNEKKPSPSRLQRELSAAIMELIRKEGLAPGTRLAEVSLADRLQVSRTPVRAALKLLATGKLVRAGTHGGYFVTDAVTASHKALRKLAPDNTDRLLLAIAGDRRAGRLPDEVSERDLMQRYAATRPVVQRVLTKLAEVAAVQRKPGHGWRFHPIFMDEQARQESYRYRIMIEPAALLEPGFRLDPAWAAGMRRRHEEALTMPWNEAATVPFYEMNAAFHEGLAAASGNRYLLMAIQQQNRLRRLTNYDWRFGHERVVVSCSDHLAILGQLEAGQHEAAAALLRRHLESTAKLKHHWPNGEATE